MVRRPWGRARGSASRLEVRSSMFELPPGRTDETDDVRWNDDVMACLFKPAKSFLLQKRILVDLVDYHKIAGVRSDDYLNDKTGGIYEHKLAHHMNIELQTGMPPMAFQEAAGQLEWKGLVRRNLRQPDFPVKGIRPTESGIRDAGRWTLVRRTYRTCADALSRSPRPLVVWFATSVLAGGFLFNWIYPLIDGFLPF